MWLCLRSDHFTSLIPIYFSQNDCYSCLQMTVSHIYKWLFLIFTNVYKCVFTDCSNPVTLSAFPDHVHDMSADSDFKFSEEFEDLKHVGREQSTNASELPVNRNKNRFTNILPYDHSRVKLLPTDDEEGTDYINSNYMPVSTSLVLLTSVILTVNSIVIICRLSLGSCNNKSWACVHKSIINNCIWNWGEQNIFLKQASITCGFKPQSHCADCLSWMSIVNKIMNIPAVIFNTPIGVI